MIDNMKLNFICSKKIISKQLVILFIGLLFLVSSSLADPVKMAMSRVDVNNDPLNSIIQLVSANPSSTSIAQTSPTLAKSVAEKPTQVVSPAELAAKTKMALNNEVKPPKLMSPTKKGMLALSNVTVSQVDQRLKVIDTPEAGAEGEAVKQARDQNIKEADNEEAAAPTSPAPITSSGPTPISNPSSSVTDTTKKPSPTYLWNLQDADILSVINEVSQETGRNFVVDPRVSGKITLISSKPIHKEDSYQVFLSILELLGYSAIPSGKVTKIVPNMESGEMATRVADNASPGRGDEVVVRVISLRNISASQLIPVLRPLLPQWSNVSAYTPGNVLILLGRAANLQRIMDIIIDVDRAANNNIEMIPLHHATASQVVNVLNNLQNAARSTGESPTVSIAADERSNSVLLSGPCPARIKMRVLIAQIDAPASSSLGNTEVIYLRYLQAKTLAPILAKIAQNILGKNDTSATASATVTSPTGTSATTTKEETYNSSNIQAEPNTNAIVITAPAGLMQALKSVIAKLDVRPAQVLVEAIIAEVSEANLKDLGIQWGTLVNSGASSFPQGGTAPTDFPVLGGGGSGASGAGIVGIIPSMQIRAVLSILENTNGVDILSTPSVVVLDNQEATISVGQQVPEQSGQYATTGGGNGAINPFTTINNKDVLLKLVVTPQINLGSAVRLKINLNNDSLANPNNPSLTPTINKSQIKNTVLVNNCDILVLGGLIRNATNETTNKVPILGDVPLVGNLFKQTTRTQEKKNLMVFIKPIIMHNGEENNIISSNKYEYTRQQQMTFSEDLEKIGKIPLQTVMPGWGGPHRELPQPFESSQ